MNNETRQQERPRGEGGKTPLLIGLRAAKANLLPGLVIQTAMISIVIAYYTVPRVHDWLSVLAEIKLHGGLPFSAAAAVVAGAVLPEVLTITLFQRGKITLENLGNLLFNAALWGFEGMIVDLFYRTQAQIFGSHADFPTVFKKVLVDQLVYTPFFATPFSVGCFEWKHQNYSLEGMSRVFTLEFYKNKSVPALIASWGVWIPLVSILYSLPSLLQFPLFTLGLTFWVMMLTYVTSAHKKKTTLSFPAPPGNPVPLQP